MTCRFRFGALKAVISSFSWTVITISFLVLYILVNFIQCLFLLLISLTYSKKCSCSVVNCHKKIVFVRWLLVKFLKSTTLRIVTFSVLFMLHLRFLQPYTNLIEINTNIVSNALRCVVSLGIPEVIWITITCKLISLILSTFVSFS